jgi:hypothetical protein
LRCLTDGPIDLTGEGRRLVELCRCAGDRAGIPIDHHVAVGRPDHAILSMARQLRSDLVVIGTRRRSGLARALLGPLTDRIVHFAPCPVLVVPEDDTRAHRLRGTNAPRRVADLAEEQRSTRRAAASHAYALAAVGRLHARSARLLTAMSRVTLACVLLLAALGSCTASESGSDACIAAGGDCVPSGFQCPSQGSQNCGNGAFCCLGCPGSGMTPVLLDGGNGIACIGDAGRD